MLRNDWHLLAATPFLFANGAPTSTTEIEVDNPTVTITIDGRLTTMEVVPDGPNSPILNARVADQLGKKGSLVSGRHMVGRTAVSASSNMARIDFGDGRKVKQRLFWFDRDWTEIAEGRMGPALLPEDIVTYRLGERHVGERLLTIPFRKHGLAGFRSETVIDGVTVPVIFTFDRPETMVTATTGALLATAYGGRMVGPAQDLKLEMGFFRPVRRMEFQKPIAVGELALTSVVVRTTEMGSTASIPDDNQDPSEIVVSAESKRKASHGIFVGRSSFADCSSLTFDKQREEIRFSCL
ncbi:hypothetical protein [Allopontixanthobacter sediminis]|uniref:Aspartyl protease n=1 Tax=Allopontixanthobacter sediminis TaxID=1689985 RepID=A0A845B4N5_9SPHN|nr:hypothetical protein [Allopontixanthobacter sediminis]MXP45368.1 hypothetical protein [Allopontixanthobacter sediminis]